MIIVVIKYKNNNIHAIETIKALYYKNISPVQNTARSSTSLGELAVQTPYASWYESDGQY